MLGELLRRFTTKGKQQSENALDENTPPPEPEQALDRPWIGVDLDGTLAEYTPSGDSLPQIGKPIRLMMKRVLQWTEAGIRVKVVTARANLADGPDSVKQWLAANGLPLLEVTSQKDFAMIELWDDRAIQVVHNTGKPVILPTQSAMPKGPIFPHEIPGDTMERGDSRGR